MDYTKFVSGYKTIKDKDGFIKKHMTKQYLPYANKLSIAKSIAKTCTHVKVDDKEIYKKDTPAQYFTTVMSLITQYTDIEIDANIVDKAYDALVECGAMQALLASIPESEVTEFRTLVDMCVADIFENERELASFLETKLDAINMATNQMLSSLGETLAQLQQGQDTGNTVTEFPMNPPIEE